MNSCVLMAKIISNPQLRYTQDGERHFTEMLVEFYPLRSDEPPATLKVIGWGNLATEMASNYVEGNWIILEGRLSMNRYERKEGFKETRAELVISHIYRVDGEVVASVPSSSLGVGTVTEVGTSQKDNVVAMNSFKPKSPPLELADEESAQLSSSPNTKQSRQGTTEDHDLDDIPF